MEQRDAGPWRADLGDGSYRNPVLHADYSDPDAIRVGEDFFLVSSSFSHFPGLPLLHSRDLVNWRIANHVLPRFEEPGYDRPRHGCGAWAPSLRYHGGFFWLFFGAPDEGIFMCKAADPFGAWDPPRLVHRASGWIDPCPFWDEDGRAWLVHAFARSRCGIKHRLELCPMAPDASALLGEGRTVFEDAERHPTMEGPKLYKRGPWYYIFAPAGGVKPGWQVVLRSRDLYGPYEDRTVLHQGATAVNGPHQGAWVELASGESWFLHFQDKEAYGRVVHLQPMAWEEGWPRIGVDLDGDGIGEPVAQFRKPVAGAAPLAPASSDGFDGGRLGLQWQWQANPREEWLSLAERPGRCRLRAIALPPPAAEAAEGPAPVPAGPPTLYEAPNLLLQKFPAPEFRATVRVELSPDAEGDRAGLAVFGQRYRYLALGRDGSGAARLSLVEGEAEALPARERELAAVPLGSLGASLRVSVSEGAVCEFSYSAEGGRFAPIGGPFAAAPGIWVGAKVGVFAVNAEGSASAGFADFDDFLVEGP
ncbi:MAG TPA: glycoside hydrolase 43 family protein [Spirochaetales bacterium]|nr:glycoside hydrolase 43 family protein [Spirochaetales bacterium]HRY53719.1 glycoside hydrolase 43 family protein [Spirochaetia bacterium]HRZ64559.1 glycoside hydrolase 43 family protein [Spirochaetia bacterium]